MRVVPDPNVLVSALLSTGVTAELLDRWLFGTGLTFVVCPCLLAELGEVLERPKFQQKIDQVQIMIVLDCLELRG
ncbi:MAG: hypothetical protein ACYDD6_06265, partial [Acidimicrobiales bacterium]